ncbi:MFS transporter [Paenibacillus sp. J2TS4]|uniref:MFS transporter n=1 Tax=Paenibacillus sp. J2TS4 TaxID=2807194 RepID=UPI001B031B1C|nr:MFS transporter [Paenibacillus sp. J2TS4]GIP34572.1 purine efflux pump PbuE [Paenibacillus sp. J2TS4]
MENNKRFDSKTNLGILMLAIGMFVVGTVELVFAGVLKLISTDLGVSVATTGQLVTIYAVIYAIGTPILITLTSRIERKKLLLLSLFVFILSNVIAAISPNYIFLMISRIIAAISAGIFSVSSIAFAAKLVPPEKAGKAIGTTVMGFSSSLVLGVPLGTVVGEAFGWRMTFTFVALVTLLPMLGIWLFTQKVKGEAPVPLKTQFSILRKPAMVTGQLVSAFVFIGQFSLYTYFTPFLHHLAGFNMEKITIAFFVLGIFGILGSYIGGYSVDKWGVKKTLFVTIGSRTLTLFLLPLVGEHPIFLFLIMMAWSASGWATTPANQTYLRSLAPKLADMIIAVNTSFMQLGIALGSAMGGLIISNHYSYTSLSWFAGFITLVGLFSFFLSISLSNRQGTIQ